MDQPWPKPLAIGIHHTILADLGCDPKVLHVAMHIWCSQPGYLANTIDMTYRYGLDGTPGTELTAEDRANAAKRLDAIRAALKPNFDSLTDEPARKARKTAGFTTTARIVVQKSAWKRVNNSRIRLTSFDSAWWPGCNRLPRHVRSRQEDRAV